MKAVRECKRDKPDVHVGQLQVDLCAARTVLSAADALVIMLDLDKEGRRRDHDGYAGALQGMLRDLRNAIDSAAIEADEIEGLLPIKQEAANG